MFVIYTMDEDKSYNPEEDCSNDPLYDNIQIVGICNSLDKALGIVEGFTKFGDLHDIKLIDKRVCYSSACMYKNIYKTDYYIQEAQVFE